MDAGEAGNAKNCGVPAKTRTAWASRAKETAADTARPAKDRFGGMCAANCGKRVSTRIAWANKAKETVAATAKPAEVAYSTNSLITTPDDPGAIDAPGSLSVSPLSVATCQDF